MADAHVRLAGVSACLDRAGALWLEASRTLVVADLHLEKGSSFARRRVFLPPYDSAATLAALATLVERRAPKRVVCLGDSFHDGEGTSRLGLPERARLSALQRGRDWLWITGNHDPHLPADIGGEVGREIEIQSLTFRHEPTLAPVHGEVAGHLHPSARLCRHGRSIRRRAFATDGMRLVLPAFGVLTGGLNVLDRAFAELFPARPLHAFMIGDSRVFQIAAAALSRD
ncbi:putative phosphoesterase [Faunimonas pinastri]|uniref:Putative phosphoesterase n=1 Tax=Faunimonas pinastri TaxID=1855383 RepID=A0A1H9HNK1_9HYPH|nr:ligase-associated DNA damage response endonuclease PdeM [Faunimonas pinastri]SEQ63903.1 putative phosphoesterase [Faunimonas pinastri]